ncbi:hypothetical protein [Sandaracinus amylolyticus]|uniref:hypothetical protein n=1 Tax=Sandaracinus amylolyticus TaxID=927083 RepID=UPI001F39860C|nr:hypothetical protein [Sandaracinus amylolyticus]UJR79849.1 Hypothetical protein I5071_18880 [Sandaracinus amylolyticus]
MRPHRVFAALLGDVVIEVIVTTARGGFDVEPPLEKRQIGIAEIEAYAQRAQRCALYLSGHPKPVLVAPRAWLEAARRALRAGVA